MSFPIHDTCDPYLAAFLLYKDAQLLGAERTGPKRVQFSFASGHSLHHLLRLYWGRQPLLVVPADLFAALRRLKARSPIVPDSPLLP